MKCYIKYVSDELMVDNNLIWYSDFKLVDVWIYGNILNKKCNDDFVFQTIHITSWDREIIFKNPEDRLKLIEEFKKMS